MAGECGLCHLNEHSDQKVVLRRPTELFLQNVKEQGALLGSGVIIPARHAETVFDPTCEEIDATSALLADVQAWIDERSQPDGYNTWWNCRHVGCHMAKQ